MLNFRQPNRDALLLNSIVFSSVQLLASHAQILSKQVSGNESLASSD